MSEKSSYLQISSSHARALSLQKTLANSSRRLEEAAQQQLQHAEEQLELVRSHRHAIFQLQAQTRFATAETSAAATQEVKDEEDTLYATEEMYNALLRRHRITLRELRETKTGFGTFFFVFCLGALIALIFMTTHSEL